MLKIHFQIHYFSPFWSVKYLNFPFHTFLESRHPEVTKKGKLHYVTLCFVYPSKQNTHFLVSSSWNILEVEENFIQSLSAFLFFFGDKKIAFPFDLFSHPFVIEFFWFALLQFKIEEKIRIKAFMLLMCLEVLRQGFFSSPVRDWEGVCRSL